MSYFKTEVSGVNDKGEYKNYTLCGQGFVLSAIRKIQQSTNINTESCAGGLKRIDNEDEFIINACVNVNRGLNGIVVTPKTVKEIKKVVIGAVEDEKKINRDAASSNLYLDLVSMIKCYDKATNGASRQMYENTISRWIMYNYENQNEILDKSCEEELEQLHA